MSLFYVITILMLYTRSDHECCNISAPCVSPSVHVLFILSKFCNEKRILLEMYYIFKSVLCKQCLWYCFNLFKLFTYTNESNMM